MEDDDEIQPHSSPPNNGQIAVSVAALVPLGPPQPPNSLTLALPIQHHQKTPSSASGGREDCWSEGATAVLIDAWGKRYLELSRGNLKQKHWQDVADIVSRRKDNTKTPKTDVQCKNRIDAVKKKYKAEKVKIAGGGGPSEWRFNHKLDELIGPPAKTNSTPPTMDANDNHNTIHPKVPMDIPVGLRSSSTPQDRFQNKPGCKRPHFDSDDESEPEHSADTSDGLPPETNKWPRFQKIRNNNGTSVRHVLMNNKSDAGNKESGSNGGKWGNSMKELSRAILKFGQVYGQAETTKLQQLVELEKQRMKFAKDLELQRMQYFMKTQLELSQLKGRKHGTNNDDHHSLRKSNDYGNNVSDCSNCECV